MGRAVPDGGHAPVTVVLTKGLDLDLPGAPDQTIHPGPPVHEIAVRGTDFIGLQPRLLVEEGARVKAGDALIADKFDPAVTVTAPGTGTVVRIGRGRRRALEDIVIRLGEDDTATVGFEAGARKDPGDMDRGAVVDRLCASGLWPSIRSRPFSRVPHTSSVPTAIFVTAVDTQPLAADPEVVIRARLPAFATGLRVLAKLSEGPLWLCTGPGWALANPPVNRIRHARFGGPHPAGLPGTHIHCLHPVGGRRTAWHVGYQDVIAMGRLFGEGELDHTRVVALGGESASSPRLVQTRLGASLDELMGQEISNRASSIVLSGSPLPGRRASSARRFLGRFDLQVCAFERPPGPRAFGWWWRGRQLRPARDRRGTPTGMLPLERFEALMPPGFLVVPLLRALMAGDTERARELGCLELDEADLALCAWVCPARCDYPGALRSTLDRIEREG